MKKKNLLLILLVLVLGLTACTKKESPKAEAGDEKILVVSSFTIISDMARQIGGEKVEVHNLVPTGEDPHEYEPLPDDIKAAEDADVLLYNGMNLEGGEEGWFMKMIESTNQDINIAFELTDGAEPMYLSGDDGQDEEINPHSFIDPQVGMLMAENLRDALQTVDPENKDYYEENASAYLEELAAIDQKYEDVIQSIPEENRILVTSERAFQYMTARYGLKEAFVWAIDTEENGTPEQIKNLVDTLRELQPPVLFLESNVDPRPLETVSRETGIPIFEEAIYSDEIGQKGDEVDTYKKFLEHNIRIIEEGLKGD